MNEAMRDWVTNVDNTFYLIGTVAGILIALAGGTSTPTPDPTATSTATEAPAPAAQGSTGDILDADTAQALNGAVRTAFELGEATVGFGIRP